MSKFSRFQETVGKVSGDANELVSKIFGVFMIVIGVGLVIPGIIPFRVSDEYQRCKCDKDEDCVTKYCVAKKKLHIGFIIGGIICMLIGFGVMWVGKWYNKFVHKNSTNAQVGAALTEFDLVSNMLHPRSN